jgi:hypothetical protein
MYGLDALDDREEYFERAFALAEVGGYTPEEVVSDDVVSQYTADPEQVEWDIWLIRSAVEDGMLPDQYQDTFNDIYGFGRQVESMYLIPLPEIEDRVGPDIDDAVEREVAENVDLGFGEPDFAEELFLRRYHGSRLLRNDDR